MSSTINVRFEPVGTEAAVAASLRVSEAAQEAGLSLQLPCGGKGKCGNCRITVTSGQVSDPTEEELEALTPEELARGLRLACQTRIESDAVIEIPHGTQVIGKKELGEDLVRPVALAPNVRQVTVALAGPSLEDQRSDFDRLAEGMVATVNPLHAAPSVLGCLPEALRGTDFDVVACVVGHRLVGVHGSGSQPPTYGAAVDIGTTTVVAYLVDLASGELLATAAAHNEQQPHGADVISRIEYCNANEDGLGEMRDLVLKTINGVIADAVGQCGCTAEDIYEVTVVGNTAMNHLFAGLDPRYLAQTPYVPVASGPLELRPAEAGIAMHPGGNVFCLPVIAGFVGADTVGVLLATEIAEREKPVLAVDIGTNGEVVLWSGEKLLVASCAAGPAFEGAQIDHGMRAAPGAIERVSVQDGDIEIGTIDDASAVGICGSGLIDGMAAMLELGVVGPSGRFADDEAASSLSPGVSERIAGEGNERHFILNDPKSDSPVYLSQKDVRQLQLAKGAVQAAVVVLLELAGLDASDLDEVLLAGAFGNYIAPGSALRMGMLPEIPLEKIRGVGNAAGAGSLLALISTEERMRAVELARRAEHIELSQRAEFQAAFMETMMFP